MPMNVMDRNGGYNQSDDGEGGWYDLEPQVNEKPRSKSPRSNSNGSSRQRRSSSTKTTPRDAPAGPEEEEPEPDSPGEPEKPRSVGNLFVSPIGRKSSNKRNVLRRNRSLGDLRKKMGGGSSSSPNSGSNSKDEKSLRKSRKPKKRSQSTTTAPGALPYSSGREDIFSSERSSSPGRLLGRLFSKNEMGRIRNNNNNGNSNSTSPNSASLAEQEEKHAKELKAIRFEHAKVLKEREEKHDELVSKLQAEIDRITKDCKRYKKQLAKKQSKSTTQEELETTQHFAAATQPTRSAALEQAELQLDCYEKLIEDKDDKLITLKQKNFDQEKRIAYLEITCLQNGVEIDDGLVAKVQRASVKKNCMFRARAPITARSGASEDIDGEASYSTYASFFGESCHPVGEEQAQQQQQQQQQQDEEPSEEPSEGQEEVWEEELKDEEQQDQSVAAEDKNDLESALSRLPGPNNSQKTAPSCAKSHNGSVISEANASMAMDELTMSSIFNAKKKESNSWLDLEVEDSASALGDLNHQSFQIPEDEAVEAPVGNAVLEAIILRAVTTNNKFANGFNHIQGGPKPNVGGPRRVDAAGAISRVGPAGATPPAPRGKKRINVRHGGKKISTTNNSTSVGGDGSNRTGAGFVSPTPSRPRRNNNNNNPDVATVMETFSRPHGVSDEADMPPPPPPPPAPILSA